MTGPGRPDRETLSGHLRSHPTGAAARDQPGTAGQDWTHQKHSRTHTHTHTLDCTHGHGHDAVWGMGFDPCSRLAAVTIKESGSTRPDTELSCFERHASLDLCLVRVRRPAPFRLPTNGSDAASRAAPCIAALCADAPRPAAPSQLCSRPAQHPRRTGRRENGAAARRQRPPPARQNGALNPMTYRRRTISARHANSSRVMQASATENNFLSQSIWLRLVPTVMNSLVSQTVLI